MRRLREKAGLRQFVRRLGLRLRQPAQRLYGQRRPRPAGDPLPRLRRQLLPIIQRIHGTAQHKGKVPGSSALRVTDPNNKIVAVEETPLEEKKRLLKQAIETQDFERAAVLRDEIKELEQHG